MKSIAAFGIGALLATSAFAGDVYVRPHVTQQGTYVQGYMKTAPNETRLDNYSTQGNVNPYTGQAGNKPLYSAPTYSAPSYSVPQPASAYEYQPYRYRPLGK
jgi:hypothetical protein